MSVIFLGRMPVFYQSGEAYECRRSDTVKEFNLNIPVMMLRQDTCYRFGQLGFEDGFCFLKFKVHLVGV